MKPISTTLTPLDSVDLATGETAPTRYERSDFCAVPRAAVVAEAMLAFVLADAFLEKLGGDHLDELLERLGRLRRSRLTDLPMDAMPWRPWPDNDDEPVPADSDSADSAADPAAADSAADPATDAPHAL